MAVQKKPNNKRAFNPTSKHVHNVKRTNPLLKHMISGKVSSNDKAVKQNRSITTSVGLVSLKGKLISANDIGNQLRELTKKTTSKQKNNKSFKKAPPARNNSSVVVNLNIQKNKPRDRPSAPKKKRLVLFTKKSPRFKLLMENLELGTNESYLKDLIIENTGLNVERVTLSNLASGSANCDVAFHTSVINEDIIKAQQKFDGAVIDNRIISCGVIEA